MHCAYESGRGIRLQLGVFFLDFHWKIKKNPIKTHIKMNQTLVYRYWSLFLRFPPSNFLGNHYQFWIFLWKSSSWDFIGEIIKSLTVGVAKFGWGSFPSPFSSLTVIGFGLVSHQFHYEQGRLLFIFPSLPIELAVVVGHGLCLDDWGSVLMGSARIGWGGRCHRGSC